MKNIKKVIFTCLVVTFMAFTNICFAYTLDVKTESGVYLRGSNITLKVISKDIIGKVEIESSNSNVVYVQKKYDWIEGNLDVLLKAKNAGDATIVVKSYDTTDVLTEKEVNFVKQVKIKVSSNGNINGDSVIDVTDAYLLLSNIAKNTQISDSLKEESDINKDGKVDVTDAYLLLKAIASI